MTSIFIDKDLKLDYETNSFSKKLLDVFLVPILNMIPASFRGAVKKTHKSAEEVINNATNHKALEVLYNSPKNTHHPSLIQRFFHYVWFNTNNAKAVRNRLKLVKREVVNTLKEFIKEDKNVHILSIASGSARAIVESINTSELNNNKVFVTFLDKNSQALEYSKYLAKDLPKHFNLNWIEDTASNFPKYLNNKPNLNLIEMVGLLDYFDDEKAISVFSIIYKHLTEKGVLISANIDNNKEQKFVTKAIGWNMVYRNGKHLSELAIKAGFSPDKINVYYEPLGIHSVIVAKK